MKIIRIWLTAFLFFTGCSRSDLYSLISSSPYNIDSLKIWLDAEKNLTTIAGDKVILWTSESGGYGFDNTSASDEPLYDIFSGPFSFVQFGIQDTLFEVTPIVISQPFTICSVMRINGTCDNFIDGSTVISYIPDNFTFDLGGTAGSWTTDVAVDTFRTYCFIFESGSVSIYIDGIFKTTIAGVGNNDLSSVVIGTVNDVNIDLAEMLVYAKALSKSDREELSIYYQYNYGL